MFINLELYYYGYFKLEEVKNLITKFEEVFDKIKTHPKKQIVIAVAHDSTVLEAVLMAEKLDITDYILVGDEKKY